LGEEGFGGLASVQDWEICHVSNALGDRTLIIKSLKKSRAL